MLFSDLNRHEGEASFMKIHKQITNTLLNHPTEWIGILTTETPFPKLFSQIKPIRYKTGLHCIRFIQLCLKAGYSEEGEEAVQYYKTYFVDQSSKNQNTLFLAVAQWYDFFVSHSEKVKNLKSDFLETITDLHAAEAKYIGYYTLGFYYLARSEFETSRNYFIKLEQVYREYKLEDFGDFNTLRENVEILMNTRDIDEVQSFYEKNIGIFSKNTLQNRVALINICSRRGDYERVASLVTQFPAILLPKYTHIIAGFAAMKPINFNRKKVYADPEAAHVKILEGIYLSDPEFILQNASFKMQIKNSRIRVVCNIGIAWAYQRIGNFDKAIKILNLTEILPIDYDLYLFRNFTIVDILIRSHFSQIKVLSLKD
jgi:tetratricopeptide (TPR) repeat protein